MHFVLRNVGENIRNANMLRIRSMVYLRVYDHDIYVELLVKEEERNLINSRKSRNYRYLQDHQKPLFKKYLEEKRRRVPPVHNTDSSYSRLRKTNAEFT